MYTMQYYAYIQQARLPVKGNVSTIPSGIPTYALMANQTRNDYNISISYRNEKLKFANQVAGGSLTKPVIWWNDSTSNLNYTVWKSSWTADSIMGLGI
jgi:hypothetical protein